MRNVSSEGAAPKPRAAAATRRRRLSRDKDVDDGTQTESKTRGGDSIQKPVKATQSDERFRASLRQFCLNAVEVGVDRLAKQFVETRAALPKNIPKAAFLANPKRNRYKDVLCNDNTRVKLAWPPDNPNDYIHANHVMVNGTMRYICTQGPTDSTCEDFWRLVWQENCKGILMLCEVMEQGKKKCEQYWPKNLDDTMTFGRVKIKALSKRTIEDNLKVTDLELEAEGETRRCEHTIWEGWPDRGVPEQHLACLRCINRISPLVPVLVHCSAGIGRTGTIVGLEMLNWQLEKGECPSMAAVVAELRKYRHGSVQTDVQFLYMHRVMFKLAENRKILTKEEMAPFLTKYDAFVRKRQ